MSKFVCCDCKEEKDSENALESHISIDHLLWIPYECIYCREVNVSTWNPTLADMKRHCDKIHSEKPFIVAYVTDEEKKKKLREKMDRSKENSNNQDGIDFKISKPPLTEQVPSRSVPTLVDLISPFGSPNKATTKSNVTPPLPMNSPQQTEGTTTETNGFTCCHCLLNFHCISELKKHQDMKHRMNGDFSCTHCDRKFHYRSAFETHRKSHLTLITEGNGRFAEKEEVVKRQIAGYKRRVYFCLECQRSVPSCDVNRHLGVYHLKKRTVLCGMCSHGSKWCISDIKNHIKKAHKGENVKIIDNRAKFKAEFHLLKNQLIVYQKTITEALKYCLKCEKWLSVSEVGNHLVRFHLNQITMHCSVCSYGTIARSDLQRRLNRVHKNAQIIDNRPLFRERLQNLRKEIIVSESSALVKKPVEKSFSVVAAPGRVESVLDNFNSNEPVTVGRMETVRKLETTTNTLPKMFCSECESSVAEDKVYRHLAENHLEKMLVKCSLCDFGSFWSMAPVNKHIKSEHKGHTAQIVNERRKYEKELKDMKKKLIILKN